MLAQIVLYALPATMPLSANPCMILLVHSWNTGGEPELIIVTLAT